MNFVLTYQKKKKKNLSAVQSFRALEKRGFQPPQPPSTKGSQTSATQASLSTAKTNKEGKDTHKGDSSHHLSLQNLTLLLIWHCLHQLERLSLAGMVLLWAKSARRCGELLLFIFFGRFGRRETDRLSRIMCCQYRE